MRRDSPEPGNNNGRRQDAGGDPYEGIRTPGTIPLLRGLSSISYGNKVIYLDTRAAVKAATAPTVKPGAFSAAGASSAGALSSAPPAIQPGRSSSSESPPLSGETCKHGFGTLRPPPPASANETINRYETEFQGAIMVILGNLRNLQVRSNALKNNPLFDDFNFAFYLAWRNQDFGNRFSRDQAELFEEYYAVKNEWCRHISRVGELYNKWHNNLSTLIRDLKKSGKTPDLLEKAVKLLHHLRNENYGKIGWHITAENVEYFEKFVEANLGKEDHE